MSAITRKFQYGKSQMYTSARMRSSPILSRVVYNIFGYTTLGNWTRALVFKKLLKGLPLERFKSILDLGAGLGEYTFMLSEAMPDREITALEIDPKRIELLEESVKRGNFKNVRVYGDKIGTMDRAAAFDFIFAVDVFEHIREAEMPFRDCLEKLRPGGFLLVKIPNVRQVTILPHAWFEDHNQWLDDEHVGQVYDLEGLVNRFRGEGFTIFHQSYSDGWFSRLGWEIAYLSRRAGGITQLLFLPFCKMLVYLDRLVFDPKKGGNAIQVIGQKATVGA